MSTVANDIELDPDSLSSIPEESDEITSTPHEPRDDHNEMYILPRFGPPSEAEKRARELSQERHQRQRDVNQLEKEIHDSRRFLLFHTVFCIMNSCNLLAMIIAMVLLEPQWSSPINFNWRTNQLDWEPEMRSSHFSASVSIIYGLFLVNILGLIENVYVCVNKPSTRDGTNKVRDLTWAINASIIRVEYALISGLIDFVVMYYLFVLTLGSAIWMSYIDAMRWRLSTPQPELKTTVCISTIFLLAPVFGYWVNTMSTPPVADQFVVAFGLILPIFELVYFLFWLMEHYIREEELLVISNMGRWMLTWCVIIGTATTSS